METLSFKSKENNNWLKSFFILSCLNIFLSLIYFFIIIDSNYDLIGSDELNLWFFNLADLKKTYFGSNAVWLLILNLFNLVPITNNFQIFGIILISKIIQLIIYFYIYTIIGKKGDLIFALSFLPNVFIFSMTVSRASLDYSIFSLLSVLSIVLSKRKYLLVTLFSYFFKALIVFLGIVTFFSDRIIKKRSIFIFLILGISILLFSFQGQLIDFTNILYLNASFGNYSFNQSEILNAFDYLIRSTQLILPPFFYYQNILSLVFSSNYFIFYFFIFNFRKFIRYSDIVILIAYALISLPFVYNFFAVARYSSGVFLFISIRLILRKMTYLRNFKY